MSRSKANVILIVAAAALTGAVVALAAAKQLAFTGSTDWLDLVSDRGQWDLLWFPFAYFAVFVVLLALALRGADAAGRGATALAVGLLALAGFALHLSIGRVAPGGSAEAALAIPRTNIFYHNARAITSLDDFLRHYEDRAAKAPVMATRTHPPGPELFYCLVRSLYRSQSWLRDAVLETWGLIDPPQRGLDSPEVRALFSRLAMDETEVDVACCLAFTFKLLACLAVVPTYLLGSALHSRRTGLMAAACVAVLPSVHCFSPGLDQVYPLFAATMGWLALVAVKRRSAVVASLFALLLCTSLLFSLAFAVAAALTGLVIVVSLLRFRSDRSASELIRAYAPVAVAALLGFALLVLAFGVFWRVNLFSVWARCMRENAKFNVMSRRSYAVSMVSNPAEFFVFLGLPLACLFVMSVGRSVRVVRSAWLPAAGVLCLVALMLALNLTGTNRGEVARLWMFTMPFCAVAGAWWLEERRSAWWLFCALLALQVVQVACFRAALDALSLHSPQ